MKHKYLIKIIIFILILLIILFRVETILSLKEYPVGPNVNQLISPYTLCEKQDGFYAMEANTLDVVFIGSSNVHCNINPNFIWNSYGITSYDFSCDQQELGTSFYYLNQVFETQCPKVVMIDVLNSGEFEEINSVQAHYAFDHMKNDIYKFQGIINRSKSYSMELIFPIIAYHERWNQVNSNDFLYKPNEYNLLKGCFIYMVTREQDELIVPDQIPENELPEKTKQWIDMIVDLCDKNDCSCIFIKTPLAHYDETQFSYFNSFERYCNEKDIPFLNLYKNVDEIGLDFHTDYADNAHMNWKGQRKLSLYLGEYLQENYMIGNKKEMVEYATWNDDYRFMMALIDEFDSK